ncbi:MAG TPA: lysylphosphatidylglycerol synthase transmembrane domain-containing protein [Fredinandcohnia sp.]|nr:lysylphosphatidylglycerol synthase transmembrane domain-containing protein [Fredinandcohnia sp.]
MEAAARFRRWSLWGLAIAALVYLVFSVRAGFDQVAAELGRFRLALVPAILALSLGNYALRFAKWQYFLRVLGVRMPVGDSLRIFLAGLTMTITPGKAGELLKPYLVRARTGTPLSTTIPALVAERGTDALALVALATLGVGTYFAEGATTLFGIAGGFLGAVALLSSRRLSLGLIGLVGRLPRLGALQPRLEATYLAFRTCLSFGPLVLSTLLSVVAWGGECLGLYLILRGFGVQTADFPTAVFLFSFSTIAGAPSPGGLGVADVALQEGALRLVPGITEAQALGAALLCRLATLWLGVAIGAVALLSAGKALSSAAPRSPEAASPP